jgi:hypothetical protein
MMKINVPCVFIQVHDQYPVLNAAFTPEWRIFVHIPDDLTPNARTPAARSAPPPGN